MWRKLIYYLFVIWKNRIPIWYDVKLIFVAWLVLPQFRGAAFIYDKFVRERIIKRYRESQQHHNKSPKGKSKTKFVDFITSKKVSSSK